MNRAPQPGSGDRLSRAQIWIAGGLLSASALGGVGVHQVWLDGQGRDEPVAAAAEGTIPDREVIDSTLPPTTAMATTEAPVAVTSTTTTTLPNRLNIDASTTTTSTTTSLAPAPSPPPTEAPTTTAEPETTTPTTEVEQPFQLPEFGAVSPEQYEQLGRDTVYVDLGDNGCSGFALRAEGRVIGAVSALHCIPLTFSERDGRQVIDHAGSISLEQGDQADKRTTVGRIGGVLVPDGVADTMLLVGEGEDAQAVQNAYNALIAAQRPQQGDVAVVSSWPGNQPGPVDKRQAQQVIFIGTQQNVIDDGRSYGPMDVWVAGTTPDGATVSEGSSGAQLIFGNGLSGTVSLGKELDREPGIFGAADLYGNMFDVDLSNPDITAIALVTPAQPLEMTYYPLNNINQNEVYAEEIAAIQAEAYAALQDDTKPKSYMNGVLELNSEYFVGSSTSSKIREALFHVDQAGNTLIYGRDPADPEEGIGMMMFIPAGKEARLQLRSAAVLEQVNLVYQTNGDVQPVATMPDFPDYLNAFGYITPDGVQHTVGEGLMDWPAEATNSFELIVSNGQVSLATQAVGQPPVPGTPTP